ncbi:IS110 family transposase [Rhodococcus indonesiensis]|uniref:IS110 family transposase n=1 Tax=Rhodococcus indonesiensis TaxID=3055869 RepID=UPI003F6AAC27
MTSLTDLREVVDVVIGVDTHVHTHSAAAVDARTGGMLDEITVETTADGYAQLVEFADEHAALRAWAVEGTGGHGAGLTRVLERGGEVVIELDRPERAKRRHGAKSDPLDAIRAAREALARPRLGTPRRGGDRQALSVLLAARRSAVNAATDAQRQLFSLVIASPEDIRERFRGRTLPGMVTIAAGLRVRACRDVETRTTVTALRSLARRAVHWPRRPPRTRTPSGRSCGRGGQTCSRSSASDRSWLRPCSVRGPTRAGSTPRPPSRCSPVSPRSRPAADR